MIDPCQRMQIAAIILSGLVSDENNRLRFSQVVKAQGAHHGDERQIAARVAVEYTDALIKECKLP